MVPSPVMHASLSRVLLLFASSVLALAAAEGLVRFFDLGPEIQPVYRENFRLSENRKLRYELRPGSPYRDQVINSHGMRGPEIALAKPEGTFRIAVVGDSIAFGYEIDANRTFASMLERVVNRESAGSDQRVEVLNFGVPGYGIDQVVETVRSRALRFDPDLLVYAYCLNDAQSYSLEFENLLAQTTGAERGYLEDLAARQLRVYALARFALQTLRYEGRLYGETHLWHRDDPQFQAIETGDYRAYYANLYRDPQSRRVMSSGFDELAKLSSERDLPVLVVVFPLFIDLPRYALTGTHQDLTRSLAERSLASLDLTDVYRGEFLAGRHQLDRDPLHPSVLGHRIAAFAILHELLEKSWLAEGTAIRFEDLRRNRKRDWDFLDRLDTALGNP